MDGSWTSWPYVENTVRRLVRGGRSLVRCLGSPFPGILWVRLPVQELSMVREQIPQAPAVLGLSSSPSGFQALCFFGFSFSPVLENKPLEAWTHFFFLLSSLKAYWCLRDLEITHSRAAGTPKLGRSSWQAQFMLAWCLDTDLRSGECD